MPNPRVERLNLIWSEVTEKQREELIEALGFNKSFAVCDSLQEMAQRGGGMLATAILKLWNKHEETGEQFIKIKTEW